MRRHLSSLARRIALVVVVFVLALVVGDGSSRAGATTLPPTVDEYLTSTFAKSDIPGAAVAVVKDGEILTRGLGHARDGVPVSDTTAFELASCSKSFTGLAAVQLIAEGRLAMNDTVAKFLPGFHVKAHGRAYDVTIGQLLHHTSGLPSSTIGQIEPAIDDGALRRTALLFDDFEVAEPPGTRYDYASTNYDILGAVIEVASGMEFSAYLESRIFAPLGLRSTHVLRDARPTELAEGHKVAFFAERPYTAPLYRGNAPAGYIISTAPDMARWLAFQLGAVQTPLTPLLEPSHTPDRSAPTDPDSGSPYAAGWHVNAKGELSHTGGNPNFTSYVAFDPNGHFGVAVLANSDSEQTTRFGANLMALLRGSAPSPLPPAGSETDRTCSILSVFLAALLLLPVIVFGRIVRGVMAKRRRFAPKRERAVGLVGTLVLLVAVFGGVVMLPRAIANVPMSTAIVWLPSTFVVAIFGLGVLLAVGFLAGVASALFPTEDDLRIEVPRLALIGIVAGLSNAAFVLLIGTAPTYAGPLAPILYYFALVVLLYSGCQWYVDKRAMTLSTGVIHELRARLVARTLASRFQEFERFDGGRIMASLNDDPKSLGASLPVVVSLAKDAVTILAVTVYLATVSFRALAATGIAIVFVVALYSRAWNSHEHAWNENSRAQRHFLNLVDGLVRGFKELSMHQLKRRGFSADMDDALAKQASAQKRAYEPTLNYTSLGEALLFVALGANAFVLPRLLGGLDARHLGIFLLGLLYLINPVGGILRRAPTLTEARAAWGRIRSFEADLTRAIGDASGIPRARPARFLDITLRALPIRTFLDKDTNGTRPSPMTRLSLDGVRFQYPAKDGREGFSVGPVSFEATKGEIIFVVGGNGSGKTTLARLLAGLYRPTAGTISIDGRPVESEELGELVSVVFADFHLFPRLYDVTLADKMDVVEQHLDRLQLKDKVTLDDDGFSTLELSTGQRKRLALLKCLLEDRELLLFDEWAADQDPEFRHAFYRDLLPSLRRAGKLVIATTHDERYFEIADRVVHLEFGRVSEIRDNEDQRKLLQISGR